MFHKVELEMYHSFFQPNYEFFWEAPADLARNHK